MASSNKTWQEDAPVLSSSSNMGLVRRGTFSNNQQEGSNKRPSHIKRKFSFQLSNKKRDAALLDEETATFVRYRYRDVSKVIIWPHCPLPEKTNNRQPGGGVVEMNPNLDHRRAVEYRQRGNHQPGLRLTLNTRQEETKSTSGTSQHASSKNISSVTRSNSNSDDDDEAVYITRL